MFKEKKNFDMIETIKALTPPDCETYDSLVTAPICGFKSNVDYMEKASCNQRMPYIRSPTLYLNAQDDPML